MPRCKHVCLLFMLRMHSCLLGHPSIQGGMHISSGTGIRPHCGSTPTCESHGPTEMGFPWAYDKLRASKPLRSCVPNPVLVVVVVIFCGSHRPSCYFRGLILDKSSHVCISPLMLQCDCACVCACVLVHVHVRVRGPKSLGFELRSSFGPTCRV